MACGIPGFDGSERRRAAGTCWCTSGTRDDWRVGCASEGYACADVEEPEAVDKADEVDEVDEAEEADETEAAEVAEAAEEVEEVEAAAAVGRGREG
jgi:hypothetical protein